MKNRKILRYFMINMLLIFHTIYSSEHNFEEMLSRQTTMQTVAELVVGMVQTQNEMMMKTEGNGVQKEQNYHGTNPFVTGMCYFGATLVGMYAFHKLKAWASPSELKSIKQATNNISAQIDGSQLQFSEKVKSIKETNNTVQNQLESAVIALHQVHKDFENNYIALRNNNAEIRTTHDVAMKQTKNNVEERSAALLENIEIQNKANEAKIDQLKLSGFVENVQQLNSSINTCENLVDAMTKEAEKLIRQNQNNNSRKLTYNISQNPTVAPFLPKSGNHKQPKYIAPATSLSSNEQLQQLPENSYKTVFGVKLLKPE